jgi:hypothetical protein
VLVTPALDCNKALSFYMKTKEREEYVTMVLKGGQAYFNMQDFTL